jgi:hypothetical protein
MSMNHCVAPTSRFVVALSCTLVPGATGELGVAVKPVKQRPSAPQPGTSVGVALAAAVDVLVAVPVLVGVAEAVDVADEVLDTAAVLLGLGVALAVNVAVDVITVVAEAVPVIAAVLVAVAVAPSSARATPGTDTPPGARRFIPSVPINSTSTQIMRTGRLSCCTPSG